VLFTGAVGTGKTHLLFASFRLSYVEKGIFAYYTTLSDFLREYNEKQFKDHSHEQLLRDVKKVPVLLIDEITRLKSTETELDIIFRLIDYRTSNNMLTLLACNILGDVYSELSKFLGQAVTDRILDRQQVKLIPLGSKSHRTGV
jgi:DNA replication protein DnaC